MQSRTLNISPEPDFTLEQRSTPIVVYELNNEKRQRNSFSLSCTSKSLPLNDQNESSSSSPPVVVHRYSTGKFNERNEMKFLQLTKGYGVRVGGVKTVIKLLDQTDEMTFVYMEQIPWHFRVFLHTLKISNLDDPRIEIAPSRILRHCRY